MSENKTLTLATPFQSKAEHNVQGWERAGSLATGVVMVGKGLRRGGFFGLIQIAIGGVALHVHAQALPVPSQILDVSPKNLFHDRP